MHSLENQLWNLKLETPLICKCEMDMNYVLYDTH